MLARPPPAPAPSQFAKYNHQLKVGVFVATIETLHDRGDGRSEETIREFAVEEAKSMMFKVGEMPESEIPGPPVLDMDRIGRDLKRMSWHVEYFDDLCKKFVSEFDGSTLRLLKIKHATGYMKGLMARDKQKVINNTDKPILDQPCDWVNLFTANADLFIEWIRSYQDK